MLLRCFVHHDAGNAKGPDLQIEKNIPQHTYITYLSECKPSYLRTSYHENNEQLDLIREVWIRGVHFVSITLRGPKTSSKIEADALLE